MIQFNLLPDLKQDYIKAKRQKHSVIVISLLVAAASLFIFVMLFLTVNVFQKKHMSDLNKDIEIHTAKLESIKDLDKILTIQNQLNSLPSLHDQKPVTSRLFGYLTKLTPAKASIANVSLDLQGNTLLLTGQADSLSTVNKFVDTLKFTNYSYDNTTDKAFSDVVLASFGKSKEGASYTINLVFKPDIFDNNKKISLKVPTNKITTRSETEKPDESIFQALPKTEDNQ